MIATLIPVIGTLLEKLIPDKDSANKAKQELEKLEQSGELQLLIGQLEINRIEAASPSLWTSGWRPFIGWTCGAAFCYHFLIEPLILLVAAFMGVAITPPDFDMQTLLTVLLGMLGLGGFRTYEKIKGVSR